MYDCGQINMTIKTRLLLKSVAIIVLIPVQAVSQTESRSKTLAELLRITNEIYDAGISGNAGVIEKYYAESFLETDATGVLRDKSFNKQYFLPSSIKMTYKIENPQIREYDNVAILYYTWLVHEEIKSSGTSTRSTDPPIDARLQVTDTYLKASTGWKIICSSRIPLPGTTDKSKSALSTLD